MPLPSCVIKRCQWVAAMQPILTPDGRLIG